MNKAKKAVFICLTAMFVASCSNAPVNNSTSGKLTKSVNQNLPARIKITTDKAELAKYMTRISSEKEPGFKTKAGGLTNIEFAPLATVNDPTDLDAHATHVEVLGVTHDPGTLTMGVMMNIASAQEGVAIQAQNVSKATYLLNLARIALKENIEPKAVPFLEQDIKDAETVMNNAVELYNSIRFDKTNHEYIITPLKITEN